MSRRWLIAVSGTAHLAVAVGLFVSGIWRMERLHAERRRVDLGVMTPLPAASGGLVGANPADKPPKEPPKPPKIISKEPRQPHPQTPETPTPTSGITENPDHGTGPGSGPPDSPGTCTENCDTAMEATPVCGDRSVDASEQCDDGNTTDGDGCSSTCRIEVKPAPTPTKLVAPNVLQGLRVSGDTQLHPSAITQTSMIRDGVSRVDGILKVCLATNGGVASVSVLKSTKYEAYDATLLSSVRAWRYQPYLINGAAVPACSTVTFIYTIR